MSTDLYGCQGGRARRGSRACVSCSGGGCISFGASLVGVRRVPSGSEMRLSSMNRGPWRPARLASFSSARPQPPSSTHHRGDRDGTKSTGGLALLPHEPLARHRPGLVVRFAPDARVGKQPSAARVTRFPGCPTLHASPLQIESPGATPSVRAHPRCGGGRTTPTWRVTAPRFFLLVQRQKSRCAAFARGTCRGRCGGATGSAPDPGDQAR